MQFVTKEDIEAPLDFVFARAVDFRSLEKQALRRGVDLRRIDRLTHIGKGATWEADFRFRGKVRHLEATVSGFDQPNGYAVSLQSVGVEGVTTVDLVALSRSRTRLTVTLDLTAKSLGARLMIQSLRLARGGLQKKFDKRIGAYCEGIEEDWGRRG